MRSAALFFLALAACSRASMPAIDASPNPVNSAAILDAGSATIDAAIAAREDCAEPSRLTQLGTVNDVAMFSNNESLVGQKNSYDPETLAPSPLPLPPPMRRPSTPSRYADIVNGIGLVTKGDGSEGARAEDVTTHKSILKVAPCAAGGTWSYSLSTTGRFLICDSNRGGLVLWDLRVAHPSEAKSVDVGWKDGPSGEGLFIAPNDTYAVAVPVLSWGSNEPTRDGITYFNFDSRKTKLLAKASDPENDVGTEGEDAHPYRIVFCQAGDLFATSGAKELTVYRGKDGARLAGAPALKGGFISFSSSGKYLSQNRNGKTTIFRLDL